MLQIGGSLAEVRDLEIEWDDLSGSPAKWFCQSVFINGIGDIFHIWCDISVVRETEDYDRYFQFMYSTAKNLQ